MEIFLANRFLPPNSGLGFPVSLLTSCTPTADSLLFVLSFLTGAVHEPLGWDQVNRMYFPPAAVCSLMADDSTVRDRDSRSCAYAYTRNVDLGGQVGVPTPTSIICDRVQTTGMLSERPSTVGLLGPDIRLPEDKVALRRGP